MKCNNCGKEMRQDNMIFVQIGHTEVVHKECLDEWVSKSSSRTVKVMKERVAEHLKNNMPMGKAFVGDGDYECNYCGAIYEDVDAENRPVFCPTCGCLLKWEEEQD